MNTVALIQSIGYVGLFAIIFSETGLLIGFFLPGDTLLISAGILAAEGRLGLWPAIAIMIVAAVLGDATGFWIGERAGPRLFQREDSFWFRRSHLEKARRFFARHGGKTIVIARFIAAVRTFTPVVAGAAGMRYRHFVIYNVIGAVGWVCGVTLAAYAFGSVMSQFDHYIFLGTLALIPLSILVALFEAVRLRLAQKRQRQQQQQQREEADTKPPAQTPR